MTTSTKETTILEFKKDGPLLLVHLLVIGSVIACLVMHKIDLPIAVALLAALNVPGLVGVKTVPDLVAAIVAEVQKQLTPLSIPPAPETAPELPSTVSAVEQTTLKETLTTYKDQAGPT